MSAHAINEAMRTRVSNAQRVEPMRPSLRRREVFIGAAFLVGIVTLSLIEGSRGHLSLGTAALYVLAIAVAGNVRFDVGAAFTVPTQVLFVPMLFAVPLIDIPILLPLALALGMSPKVLRGELSPSWLVTALGNSWFALGPVLVLLLFHDHSPQGRVGVLLLALVAQLACDFAASVVRERVFGDLTIGELIEECKSIYAIDVALSMLGLALALATIPLHSQLAILLVAPLFGILRFFSKERHERLEQLAELNDAYQGTALLLGDVVEADDAYTGEHCKSVVRLTLELADALVVSPDCRRNVEFGALLHDIGKIAIPKEIINKPGRLDQREWEIIRTHTIEGQRMLETIGGFMSEIGTIVRAHHERWDGGGYPDGLAGEAIPIEARIIAACDAYNAMTTTRTYRRAMSVGQAREELRDCSGSQFDPQVIDALLQVTRPSFDLEPDVEPDREAQPRSGLAAAADLAVHT
jgi:putative nucleotidyltransferase with HDIG domain